MQRQSAVVATIALAVLLAAGCLVGQEPEAVAGDNAPPPENADEATEDVGPGGEPNEPVSVRILSEQLIASSPVALSPNTITYLTPEGEIRETAVTMELREYVVRAEVVRGEQREVWEGEIRSHELRPQAPDCDWAHFICTGGGPPIAVGEGVWQWPGDEVQLFAPAPDRRILAGSRERMSWLRDVSETNTRTSALTTLLERGRGSEGLRPMAAEMLQGRPTPAGSSTIVRVPAASAIGIHRLAPSHGPWWITIHDIRLDDVGDLVVTISGVVDERRYDLVFDGETWSRAEWCRDED